MGLIERVICPVTDEAAGTRRGLTTSERTWTRPLTRRPKPRAHGSANPRHGSERTESGDVDGT
eukprot:2920094-Rhodomonas_salina.5